MLPVRRTPRAAAVTAAALLSTVLLGACGSSGDDDVAEPSPGISVPADLSIDGLSPSGAASPGPSGSPAPAAPASPAPSASASASPAPSGSASPQAAASCADLQAAWSATNRALVDLSPEHPRSLVASFREAHRSITSVEPPADVAPAWAEMREYLTSAVDALADVDVDDPGAVTTAVSGALSADDTARATAASEDITAYLAESCGS
jgi:hypothetical protein